MKRLPILTKMLLLVCFALMLYAYNSGSLVNNNLVIPWVEYPPTVDGNLDAEWIFPDINLNVYTDYDLPDGGPTDHHALFRCAWGDDGFYFWAHVIDDSIYAAGANSYEQDCFEIYFDGDNSKGGSYDANDVQWRWVYGEAAGNPGPGARGTDFEWLPVSDGYNFELVIPTDSLTFTPAVDLTIGFEVQVADNDGAGREAIAKWWSESNNSWQQPVLFGTAVLGTDEDPVDACVLDLPEVLYPPQIDGILDSTDWEEVPEYAMTSFADYCEGDYLDLSSKFRAAWNDDGFYFYGAVRDDSIYTAGANSYEQDCFEIYFDGDNSKGGSYDANDVQWRWVYGEAAGNPGPGAQGTDFEWSLSSKGGYNLELAIPTDSLTFTPSEGKVIGFEVQVADNDGEGREAIAKWWSESNNSWQQPILFGTVELVATSSAPAWAPAGVAEPVVANISLSVPAIVSSSASIAYNIPSKSDVKVKLINIVGQEVKALDLGVKEAGAGTVALDASGLASGVYMCVLEACGSATAQKLTLIK